MLRRLLLLCLPVALLACGQEGVRSPRKGSPPGAAAFQKEHGVPERAREVLRYIRQHHKAPPGTEGGRHFGNFEHRLPGRDRAGHAIRYQEWDLWPKTPGRGRGPERLVTGSDGSAWYTGDHYRTFKEVRE